MCELELQWVSNAICFTLATFVYARMSVTTDLDAELFRSVMDTKKATVWIRELGPIGWSHPRIIGFVLVVSLPAWSAPIIVGSVVHDFFIWMSIGMIMSPLALPSKGPSRSDIGNASRFLGLWVHARFESWAKTLLGVGVLGLLGMVPVLSDLMSFTVSVMFPVIQQEPATDFFKVVRDGTAGLLVLMFGVRYLMSAAHGPIGMVLIAMATAYVWVTSQWYVNERYIPCGANPEAIQASLWAVLLATIMQDLLGFTYPDSDPRVGRR